MIPKVLRDIAQAITDDFTQLSAGSGDGRTDSSISEERVVAWLLNDTRWHVRSANIGKSHSRSWYDIEIGKIGVNSRHYYCDIKISTLKGYDNTNAKKAVYWFLTGEDPDAVSNQNDIFFQQMKEKEKPSERRDFYYIIVTKPEANCFIVSLKGIAGLHPAHNNLPFQCKWSKATVELPRTWKQARRHLLSVWATSIKNLIDTHASGMPKHYGNFFRNYPPPHARR